MLILLDTVYLFLHKICDYHIKTKYVSSNATYMSLYFHFWYYFEESKAAWMEKFIAINTYVKKEISQINSLTLHLEELENKEQSA